VSLVVAAVSDWYLELQFDPKSDMRAIERIASICGGTNLAGVCKVFVIFVRGSLTDESCYDTLRREEDARGQQLAIEYPEDRERDGRGSEDPF